MSEAHAILVAGGSGSRFRSSTPKHFQTVLGKPLVVHALERLQLSGSIARVILVLPPNGFDEAKRTIAPYLAGEASVVEAAAVDGGAIAALPVVETLKEATVDLHLARTVPRERLYRAQTPQCFRYDVLARAVRKAVEDRFSGTDEASLVERLPAPIRIVLGSEQNLKVTTLEDLKRVEYYLKKGDD